MREGRKDRVNKGVGRGMGGGEGKGNRGERRNANIIHAGAPE